jgi:hypothetical protein
LLQKNIRIFVRDLFVAEAENTYMLNDEHVACMRIFAIEDERKDFFWFPQFCLNFLMVKGICSLDDMKVLVSESRMFHKDLKTLFFTDCSEYHWYHLGLVNMWCLDPSLSNDNQEKAVIYFFDSLQNQERNAHGHLLATKICE